MDGVSNSPYTSSNLRTDGQPGVGLPYASQRHIFQPNLEDPIENRAIGLPSIDDVASAGRSPVLHRAAAGVCQVRKGWQTTIRPEHRTPTQTGTCDAERTGKRRKKNETKPIIWKDGRAYKRRAGGYGRRGTGDGRG